MKEIGWRKEIKTWKIIGSIYHAYFPYICLNVVILNKSNAQYIHFLAVSKYLLRTSYELGTVPGAWVYSNVYSWFYKSKITQNPTNQNPH